MACRSFQYELNQKLAADGLGASVSVQAADLSAGRRRLRQTTGTSQLQYTIVVMVPFGRDASQVFTSSVCCPLIVHPPTSGHTMHLCCLPAAAVSASLPGSIPAPFHWPPLQVAKIAEAAVKAVATDRAILRRLLQECLPADLFNSLDIEALIDEMIRTTVIEVEVEDPSGGGSGGMPPGAKAAPPPGKAVTLKVTQTIPGVKASQVGLLGWAGGWAAKLLGCWAAGHPVVGTASNYELITTRCCMWGTAVRSKQLTPPRRRPRMHPQVDTDKLGDGMATELNKVGPRKCQPRLTPCSWAAHRLCPAHWIDPRLAAACLAPPQELAKKGLTSSVTATATDSTAAPSSGRRLLQGSYGDDTKGGAYGGGVSCIVTYVIVIPIPAGQTSEAVEEVGSSTAMATAKNPAVLMILLQVSRRSCSCSCRPCGCQRARVERHGVQPCLEPDRCG